MVPLRGVLQSELEEIIDGIVQMGERTEHAILKAVEALQDQDTELAQEIIDQDEVINQLRFQIEALCFVVLATQQPTAIDLRTVVAALNVITDLERIADYAKGIGQLVIRTEGESLLMPLHKMPLMAEAVTEMLRASLDAFVHRDAEAAQAVIEMDDEIDHMYRDIFETIIQEMVKREQSVRKGMHLLFAAHNLERMGDRITNIAERVIFAKTGVMKEQNL